MRFNTFIFLSAASLFYKATCLSYNDVRKCKNVATDPNFVLTASIVPWHVLYVLDTPKGRTLACSVSNTTHNYYNGMFYTNTTSIGVDGSREEILSRRFDLRQGRLKEFIFADDGSRLEFSLYFLKNTGCKALVYYRCSNHGTSIYDARYIISSEQSISNDCLTKSLAVANAHGFQGKQFIKLPNPPGECQAI